MEETKSPEKPDDAGWIRCGHLRYRVLPSAGSGPPAPPSGVLPPPSPPTSNIIIRWQDGVALEPSNHFVTKWKFKDLPEDKRPYFIFRAIVEPRRGVLLHTHTQNEVFLVLRGEFEVRTARPGKPVSKTRLQAGDIGNFLAGTVHAFHNPTKERAVAILTVIPGGLEGFFEQANPAQRGTPAYEALSAKYGMKELGQDFIVNSLDMPIVKLPAGKFQMGTPDSEASAPAGNLQEFKPGDDEKPQHEVAITRRFGLAMYQVTVGQFEQFVNDTQYITEGERNGVGSIGIDLEKGWVELDPKYNWRRPSIGGEFTQSKQEPVVCVSWNDAQEFCRWLSKKEKKKYRLPTEAEWEYACRAGSTTRYFFGDDPTGLEHHANVADESLYERWVINEANPALPFFPVGTHLPPYAKPWNDGWPFTAPVGSFTPNDWFLYDMSGNVGEWCHDWYDPDYYKTAPHEDPQGPDEAPEMDISGTPGLPPTYPKKKKLRVVRGGVWLDPEVAFRSADRRTNWRHPVDSAADIGFRIALEWNSEDWDPFEPEK